MSWDVMIFAVDPQKFKGNDKMPPLGDAAAVRQSVANSLPDVDWKDPAWGILEGKGWIIEFNQNATGKIDSIMLHVRGGGDPLNAIVKLCKENGWVAYDTGSDELINLSAPSTKSWEEFQAFRDKAVAHVGQNPPGGTEKQGHPLIYGTFGTLFLFVVFYLLFRKSK